MKKSTLLTTFVTLLSLPLASAVTIVVGDDGDQTPAGPTPSLDTAVPMIIVDYQANLYTNSSGSAESYNLGNFNFFAQGNGDVTPFVALLTGPGTGVGDYDILAVGTTRIGGTDFTPGGVVSLPFGGSSPITVPNGSTLVGGIQQGTSNGNVVPFNSNSGLNTFITGGGGAGDLSAVSVGGDITAGGSTWTSLNGGRNYEFTIDATTVPEPSATLLIPAALGGLLLMRRRRR